MNGDLTMAPTRRTLGLGLGAAAFGLAGGAVAQDHPAIEPRKASPRPKPFVLRVNPTPAQVGMSAERLKRISAYLQRAVDEGRLSGCVAAVARRGQLVHYQALGYANASTKAPMPMDAIFRMASSTKPITGVALMMMIEEGKVRLSDPISRFIPEFRDTKVAVLPPGQPERRAQGAPPRQMTLVPANRPITIQDLATHTSGLMSGGAGQEISSVTRGPNDTLATYIPRLGAVPLDFQPGSRWQYSGGAGIDTLGRVVEITSGMDLDTFFRRRIFEPLGMNDTHFNLPPAKQARLLPQQRRGPDGHWTVTPNPAPTPSRYFAGAGGLVSTCKDYLLFEQMLVNRGELNGQRLLGSRMVEQMGANLIGNLYLGPGGDVRGHGFGVTVRVVTDWAISGSGQSDGAFGWDGAFGTISWNDRAEEIAAVLMTQQRNVELQNDFQRVIRQAIID